MFVTVQKLLMLLQCHLRSCILVVAFLNPPFLKACGLIRIIYKPQWRKKYCTKLVGLCSTHHLARQHTSDFIFF
jgi:hypothetical protein